MVAEESRLPLSTPNNTYPFKSQQMDLYTVRNRTNNQPQKKQNLCIEFPKTQTKKNRKKSDPLLKPVELIQYKLIRYKLNQIKIYNRLNIFKIYRKRTYINDTNIDGKKIGLTGKELKIKIMKKRIPSSNSYVLNEYFFKLSNTSLNQIVKDLSNK